MNLSLESQVDGISNLSLSGKISQTAVDVQSDQLNRLLGSANLNQKILVSLQKTEYIDSSGIGWLLATDKKIRDAGGRLILHSVPLDIQHVFGLMKLNSVLKIARDKQQANSLALEETQNG